MAVESLFKAAPALRWDEDKMTATGPRGISARVWRSAVSGKLVLSVDVPGARSRAGRVSNLADAQAQAEDWLREDGHA